MSEIAATTNTEIWDRIYAGGQSMWYPSEALVRIVRRHEKLEGFRGTILDHGCGSGPVAEFLARSGHKVICSEVSADALEATAARFVGTKLETPQLIRFDSALPLRPQLPLFDHVVAWGSLHYNSKTATRRQIAELIECLPYNGVFVMAVPTINDLSARASEMLADGTRRLLINQSGQHGALLAIPDSQDDLLNWCTGITVRDMVTFGMTFDGEKNEYVAVYGVKL
jgi:cyclopropane fatty-acyl-phospholipid synthase-like methyltransferase